MQKMDNSVLTYLVAFVAAAVVAVVLDAVQVEAVVEALSVRAELDQVRRVNFVVLLRLVVFLVVHVKPDVSQLG